MSVDTPRRGRAGIRDRLAVVAGGLGAAIRRAFSRRLLALGLWAAGVALALYAQRTIADHVDRGRLLFLSAAALTVAGMRLIDKERPAPPAGETRSRPVLLDWRTRRARVGSGLIGLGLLCSLVAAKLEADRASFAANFAMWVASLGLALTGAAVGSRSPTHVRLPTFTRRRIGRG